VSYTVSHELAHQWFGNLVTMNWWNEVSKTQYIRYITYSLKIWLNEGFATWVGWLAVDYLYPEWKSWSGFCSGSLHIAFTHDSIRNSHPINVPVRHAEEVSQVFDTISYKKGASIRMLAEYLSTEIFFSGVADYLKAHEWSNATTKDLWDALSKVSKQDVNSFMAAWTGKMGFPVVKVTEQLGQISVKQSRFLVSGDVEAKDDKTTWWIPLTMKSGDYKTSIGREFDVISQALTTKSDTISINGSFYKLNANMTGFYRTSYPAERLKKFGKFRNMLSEEDCIGLVDDAAALAQSGDSTTAACLSLIEGFADEIEYK
jgi:aminopeptidase N